MRPKAIQLNGKNLGDGRFPAICVPLVGRTRDRLLSEAAIVVAKQPDIIEWRVDFFEDIADTVAVTEMASCIRQVAGEIPLLFTRRSAREGGEPIALSEAQVVDLYRAVCAGRHVEMVDFEMSNDAADVREVRALSHANGVRLILSFHDFKRTPALDILNQRFAQAESMGADVAKVAVMPKDMADVLTLLNATLQASQKLAIPVVSMSMGAMGALTRLCGWAFGSAMTFGVGENSSAPGQMPAEDLAAGLAILQRAFGKVTP
jgi:3-dehydroquinate dehydratase-1